MKSITMNTQMRVHTAMLLGAVFCVVFLVVALVGCAPQTNDTTEVQTQGTDSNDTTVRGEYATYDAEAVAAAASAAEASGSAIEGSGEEELQQERIAGGAVGARVSENLEPLEGVVDGGSDEYIPVFGDRIQAPLMAHSDGNLNCTSCHDGETSTVQMPKSHKQANLNNDDCRTCHEEQ